MQRHFRFLAFQVAAFCMAIAQMGTQANADIFIADRLTGGIYRYSDSGELLGTVLDKDDNPHGPSAIRLSPDGTSLFVTNFDDASVSRYSYDSVTHKVSAPQKFASGIVQPSALEFSPDGSKIYVASLAGYGITQFDANDLSFQQVISGPLSENIYSIGGLTHNSDGDLLVAGFYGDFPEVLPNPGYAAGGLGIVQASTGILAEFAPPSPLLLGASGLLVHGDDLYVTSSFAGLVQRFNAITGVLDSSFFISGLHFPQSLLVAPDGEGLLVSTLGEVNGGGKIDRYSFNGDFLGEFAFPSQAGFSEATSMIYVAAVPEPGSIAMLVLVASGASARSFIKRRKLAPKNG